MCPLKWETQFLKPLPCQTIVNAFYTNAYSNGSVATKKGAFHVSIKSYRSKDSATLPARTNIQFIQGLLEVRWPAGKDHQVET